jgi:hypothetical protein
MTNANHQISVIITVHKERRQYLPDAVNSVLKYKPNNLSLQIVIASDYNDVYLENLTKNFNVKLVTCGDSLGEKLIAGLENSTYDLIAFLEDDDMFLPKKLERVDQLFSEFPNLEYYHNEAELLQEGNNAIDDNHTINNDIIISRASDYKHFWKLKPDYNMSSIVISRSLADAVIRKVENNTDFLSVSPDTFIFLTALDNDGTVGIDRNRLSLVRIHESLSQVSPRKGFEKFIELGIDNELKFYSEYLKFFSLFSNKKVQKLISIKLTRVSISLTLLNKNNKRVSARELFRYLVDNIKLFRNGDSILHMIYILFLAVIPVKISKPLYRKRYFNYIRISKNPPLEQVR